MGPRLSCGGPAALKTSVESLATDTEHPQAERCLGNGEGAAARGSLLLGGTEKTSGLGQFSTEPVTHTYEFDSG